MPTTGAVPDASHASYPARPAHVPAAGNTPSPLRAARPTRPSHAPAAGAAHAPALSPELAACEVIPAGLRQLFVPQLEQYGCVARVVGSGIEARATAPGVTGRVWVQAAGPWCFAIYHDVQTERLFDLVEEPLSCLCLCSANRSTANEARLSRPLRHPESERSVFAYARPEGTERYALPGGTRYESSTICMLPEFLDEAVGLLGPQAGRTDARPTGARFEELEQALSLIDPDVLPHELVRVFATLGPEAIGRPACALHVRAQALEAVAILADHALSARDALDRAGDGVQKGLVSRARALVDDALDRPLPLDELAARLYVSRTSLCEAFRRETGESLGAYVRRRRVERAQDLLATTDMTVAEVARRVGYARPGSFTEAFARETGATPTAWRAERRG